MPPFCITPCFCCSSNLLEAFSLAKVEQHLKSPFLILKNEFLTSSPTDSFMQGQRPDLFLLLYYPIRQISNESCHKVSEFLHFSSSIFLKYKIWESQPTSLKNLQKMKFRKKLN